MELSLIEAFGKLGEIKLATGEDLPDKIRKELKKFPPQYFNLDDIRVGETGEIYYIPTLKRSFDLQILKKVKYLRYIETRKNANILVFALK